MELYPEVPKEKSKLAELEMIFEKFYGGWAKESLKVELEALCEKQKEKRIEMEIKQLRSKLDTFGDDEEDKINEILQKIQALQETEKK